MEQKRMKKGSGSVGQSELLTSHSQVISLNQNKKKQEERSAQHKEVHKLKRTLETVFLCFKVSTSR